MSTALAIFKQLKKVAPLIHFDVAYERDPDFQWDGDGPDPGNKGYLAYNVDVSASAIVNGRLVAGISSLGGTYEIPGKRDPNIGGYLPQLLEEAAAELRKKHLPPLLAEEAKLAHDILKRTLKTRYGRQTRRRK